MRGPGATVKLFLVFTGQRQGRPHLVPETGREGARHRHQDRQDPRRDDRRGTGPPRHQPVRPHHQGQRPDRRHRHTTTNHHLLWDATTRRWVKAAALKYGTHLRTPDGDTASVVGGYRPSGATGWGLTGG